MDLVAARDLISLSGNSYHEMEEASESEAHRSAREEAIGYFLCHGYNIYPEGVGVAGVMTLADFFAVRDRRSVFVEVLSDANIRPDVLERKKQLQKSAELCFVVFRGNRIADDPSLVAAKAAISAWADVLYCIIHGWTGNRVVASDTCTLAYDTVRSRGIQVARSSQRIEKKSIEVCYRFDTKMHRNPFNIQLTHPTWPIRSYENIFHRAFLGLAKVSEGVIKRRGRGPEIDRRAMRRSSGLRMVDSKGTELARLRSDFRVPPIDNFQCAAEDWPDEYFYGVFKFRAVDLRDEVEGQFHSMGVRVVEGISIETFHSLSAASCLVRS